MEKCVKYLKLEESQRRKQKAGQRIKKKGVATVGGWLSAVIKSHELNTDR